MTFFFSQGFAIASAQDVSSVYMKLMGETRELLGVSETDVCPHNIVMWKDWLIVLP